VTSVVASEAAAEKRWEETWSLAGLPPPGGLLRQLIDLYAQPHRAYHNLGHVMECLELAASVRLRLANPPDVELALWYHDAVYQPRAADNEERSAALAAAGLTSLQPSRVETITALIVATKHQAIPTTQDARFVVDIDLAILGAAPPRFDAYEVSIRREYRWVPGPLFARKRREVLRGFLGRPSIYSTPYFRSRLEEQARANLTRSLARLS
jgi:predicted metal-dependent HD superfamily phosphohydrolase